MRDAVCEAMIGEALAANTSLTLGLLDDQERVFEGERAPADQAGVQRGDIVVGVGADAVTTQAELYRKLWSLGPAGTEVPLKVLQGASVKEIKVRSIDRTNYFRVKPSL